MRDEAWAKVKSAPTVGELVAAALYLQLADLLRLEDAEVGKIVALSHVRSPD